MLEFSAEEVFTLGNCNLDELLDEPDKDSFLLSDKNDDQMSQGTALDGDIANLLDLTDEIVQF